MDSLPVSVIIITKNAEDTLNECLGAVTRNNPAEIIVVDGKSTDHTVQIARDYTPRIYSDGGGGKSAARQLGAEQSTQEYIAYIDADVFLTDNALSTMLSELQNSDCVSISGQQTLDYARNPTYWQRSQYQHARLSYPEKRPPGISMAGCLFRRETILEYGFELAFKGTMDDIDLEYRLRQDGYDFGRSSAVIYHHGSADFRSFVSYRFFLGQVKTCYVRKFGLWHAGFWPPLYTLYWLAFSLLKVKFKLIPYFIVNGIAETAGMIQGFLTGYASGKSAGIEYEHGKPHRQTGDCYDES